MSIAGTINSACIRSHVNVPIKNLRTTPISEGNSRVQELFKHVVFGLATTIYSGGRWSSHTISQ